MSVLFLLLACFAAVIASVAYDAYKTRQTLARGARNVPKKLPRMISALIVAAQISELGTLVQHVSLANVIATAILFAIIIALSSGTAGSLE